MLTIWKTVNSKNKMVKKEICFILQDVTIFKMSYDHLKSEFNKAKNEL